MNLKTFAKAVRRSAGKNASKILGGLAITGSITAVYFAVTATPKAMILLDEKKQELGVEKLDVKTIVKTAGPVYVPTALSMVLSAGCVIGAVHVDERRNAALAAACTLSESALKTYQDKVPRRNRRSGRPLHWKRWPSAPNRQPSSLPRTLPRPMFPTTSG